MAVTDWPRTRASPEALDPDAADPGRLYAVGSRILEGAGRPASVVSGVRHCAERVDGRGGPDGLAGSEVPIGSQVVAAAAEWVDLTSDRPWRPAAPPHEAARWMVSGAEPQFDPRVVGALLEETDAEALAT